MKPDEGKLNRDDQDQKEKKEAKIEVE